MKVTVLAESFNILSIFIMICLLQQCLRIVARYVSLSFFLFSIFFIILPFRGQGEMFYLAWNRRETRDNRPLGKDPDRSWCHFHTSLKLFWSRPMAPGHRPQHTSTLPLSPWIHGQRSRKLHRSVAVTPAPIRVLTQRPLVPSFTSVVG